MAPARTNAHSINLHRKLGSDELRARYRRLKSDNAASEIEEWLEAEQEDFAEYDYYYDPSARREDAAHPTERLNDLWMSLMERLQGAMQFNPLPRRCRTLRCRMTRW